LKVSSRWSRGWGQRLGMAQDSPPGRSCIGGKAMRRRRQGSQDIRSASIAGLVFGPNSPGRPRKLAGQSKSPGGRPKDIQSPNAAQGTSRSPAQSGHPVAPQSRDIQSPGSPVGNIQFRTARPGTSSRPGAQDIQSPRGPRTSSRPRSPGHQSRSGQEHPSRKGTGHPGSPAQTGNPVAPLGAN